jgi:LysM repeat protein
MDVAVRSRVNGRTTTAVVVAVVAIVLAACGGERSYDNPPEVPIGTASSSTQSTAPTTTAFVPTTAPTTLPPPTNPPPQTAPPTFAPQTAPPTQPTIPTSPVPTSGERYTVVQGDTLFGISRKLNVRMPELLAANGLNENSLIVPGQQLDVPQGGSVPATQAQAPQTQAPAPQPTSPQPTSPPPSRTTAPPATTAAPPRPAGPAPTTTFAPPANAVVPRETSASCQAPNSTEADGTPIVFSPGNVLDHNPATAWRCPAPATGQTLSFSFDGPTHLTSVGLIGGYVKVDPLTGVDRFPQNHRVRQVRWTFSDGTTVTQDLSDSRSMQSINVDVTTTNATLEILATYPPGDVEDAKQMVPIAEVQFGA